MIGILLCAVCLAGLTWAWFSASINTKPQTMTAANFDVQIEVVDSNGLSASLGMLKGGEIYTLTLIEQGKMCIRDRLHTVRCLENTGSG